MLVIIGLIIGGILVGRDLIRSSQLNTIVSDKEKYVTAVYTFRDKYGELPGDMKTATKMWGVAGGSASDNYTTSCYAGMNNYSPGVTITCNGDGDQNIGCAGTQLWQLPCGPEGFLVWQHLADAKLISGAFVPTSSPNDPQGHQMALESLATNVPVSKVDSGAGWSIWYLCVPSSENMVFTGTGCSNKIFYGAASSSANFNWTDLAFYPTFTTAEAKRMDQKVDDGKPGTGNVTTFTTNAPFGGSCATTALSATANYDLTQSGPQCSLIFNGKF